MSDSRKRIPIDGVDRISNLPVELLSDEILMRLPIKDAVKTSLLSTNWRYRWASMPKLVFQPVEGEPQSDKLVNFVNQAFLLHNGTVSLFQIDKVSDSGCSDVDRWIVVLSKKKLKHLILKFNNANHRLKSIYIHLDFECSKAVMGLLCLLRSSPILESLHINAKRVYELLDDELYVHLDDKNAWKAPEPTIFHHLKDVGFSNFKGLEQELKLTEFILSKAVVLGTFNIIWDEILVTDDKLKIVMNMNQFQRASSKVKVIFNKKGQ